MYISIVCFWWGLVAGISHAAIEEDTIHSVTLTCDGLLEAEVKHDRNKGIPQLQVFQKCGTVHRHVCDSSSEYCDLTGTCHSCHHLCTAPLTANREKLNNFCHLKSYGWIPMKFSGHVQNGTRKK